MDLSVGPMMHMRRCKDAQDETFSLVLGRGVNRGFGGLTTRGANKNAKNSLLKKVTPICRTRARRLCCTVDTSYTYTSIRHILLPHAHGQHPNTTVHLKSEADRQRQLKQ